MQKIKQLYLKYQEIINYLIVGVLTTIVSLGIKFGLFFTILDADNTFESQLCVIIAWVGAVLFAYFTNRIFVFKSKSKNIIKEMASFFGARILTYLMEAALTFVFFTLLGLTTKLWVVIVQLIIQVVVTIFNYIFSKLFVFKKKQ